MDHEPLPIPQPQPRFGVQCPYPGCSVAVISANQFCAKHTESQPLRQATSQYRQFPHDGNPQINPENRPASMHVPGLPVNSRLGEEFQLKSQRTAKKVAQSPGRFNAPHGFIPFTRAETRSNSPRQSGNIGHEAQNRPNSPANWGEEILPVEGPSRKRPALAQHNPPPKAPILRPNTTKQPATTPQPFEPTHNHMLRAETAAPSANMPAPPTRAASAMPQVNQAAPQLLLDSSASGAMVKGHAYEATPGPGPHLQSLAPTLQKQLESQAHSWHTRQEMEKQQMSRKASESSESRRRLSRKVPQQPISLKRVPDGLPAHIRDALIGTLPRSTSPATGERAQPVNPLRPPPELYANRAGNFNTPEGSFVHSTARKAPRQAERDRQVADSEARRLGLAASFDQAAFDAKLYAQDRDGPLPPNIVVPVRRQNPTPHPEGSARLHIPLDPRIHWPLNWTDEWYEAKMAEIKARGGRKANFGRAAQRRKQQRLQTEAQMRAEKVAAAAGRPPPRPRPEPWTHRRPVDFGDVPESELPDYVKANPEWVRACEWMRSNRAEAAYVARERTRLKAAGESIQNMLGPRRR